MSLRNRIIKSLSKIGIKEDRSILITCIALSLFFWLVVKLSKSYVAEKEVRFFYFLPEDKAFSSYPPLRYNVEIQGTGWDLLYEYFSDAQIRLVYNLEEDENLVFNQMRLRNDIRKQFSSEDIEISSFDYEGFRIALEDRVALKVPILLQSEITFADQYHLKDSIILTPDSVLLSGPKSLIDTIFFWNTTKLRLSELKQSVTQNLSLVSPPQEIDIDVVETQVTIGVEQYTEKVLKVAVEVMNTADSVIIFPPKIDLTCVVGLSQYNQLDPKDFRLVADFGNAPISKVKNTIPIKLIEFPDYVRSVFLGKKSVEFFIVQPSEE